MEHKRINDFDILFKKGKGDACPACVILHGYGASYNDLAPLHSYLDKEEAFDWYFVDAPFSVDIGMGMKGKAWFPIDMMRLQMLLQAGKFEEAFASNEPSGLQEITQSMVALLQAIKSPGQELILGGFSQGSMVSTSVKMSRPELVDALMLLSSTVYNSERFKEFGKSFKDLPIFQSHGMFDPVLPFNMAQRLYATLNEHTDDISFESFEGGHEIPMAVIQKASAFLRRFS